MAEITIKASEGEQPLDVEAGDTVTVELEESIGTGYSWEVRGSPAATVEVVESTYAPAEVVRPGAAGVRRVRLAARARGAADVELVLRRPWEGSDTAARRVVLRFTVT